MTHSIIKPSTQSLTKALRQQCLGVFWWFLWQTIPFGLEDLLEILLCAIQGWRLASHSAALSYRAERMTYFWLEPVWHPWSGKVPKKLGDWDPQFVDKAQTTCLRPWYHMALQNKQPGPDGRQSQCSASPLRPLSILWGVPNRRTGPFWKSHQLSKEEKRKLFVDVM